MNFLQAMNKVCYDNYDLRYADVTHADMVKLDGMYGRDISLEDGLQHPEKVSPRTKVK